MIGLVFRKEFHEQWSQLASRKLTIALNLFLVVLIAAGAGFFGRVLATDFNPWISGLIVAAAAGGIGSGMSLFFVLAGIPDSIAGERERHTLETLLAGPLRSSDILWGKIFALLAMASIAAAITMALVPIGLLVGIGPEGLLLGFLAPIAAVIGTVIPAFILSTYGALVSHRSKGVKEAGQVISLSLFPLYLLPGILISLGGTLTQNAWIVMAIVIGAIMFAAAIACPILAHLLFTRPRLMFVAKANKK